MSPLLKQRLLVSVLSAVLLVGAYVFITDRAFNKGVLFERTRLQNETIKKTQQSQQASDQNRVELVSSLKDSSAAHSLIEQQLQTDKLAIDAMFPDPTLVSVPGACSDVADTSFDLMKERNEAKSQLEIESLWKAFCLDSDHVLCK